MHSERDATQEGASGQNGHRHTATGADEARKFARSIMKWTFGARLLIVGAILVSQMPIQAQGDDTQLPVSIERIRAALKEPPPILRVPAPSGDMPTFHVEVRERRFVLQPVDENPNGPTFGLPSVGGLMMDGVDKIRSAVVNYKRGLVAAITLIV